MLILHDGEDTVLVIREKDLTMKDKWTHIFYRCYCCCCWCCCCCWIHTQGMQKQP